MVSRSQDSLYDSAWNNSTGNRSAIRFMWLKPGSIEFFALQARQKPMVFLSFPGIARLPQWRELFAASRLRRLRPSNIQSGADDFQTAHSDLGQFLQSHFEAPELEEESCHTQPSDTSQLTALLGKIQQLSERLFPGPVSFEH